MCARGRGPSWSRGLRGSRLRHQARCGWGWAPSTTHALCGPQLQSAQGTRPGRARAWQDCEGSRPRGAALRPRDTGLRGVVSGNRRCVSLPLWPEYQTRPSLMPDSGAARASPQAASLCPLGHGDEVAHGAPAPRKQLVQEQPRRAGAQAAGCQGRCPRRQPCLLGPERNVRVLGPLRCVCAHLRSPVSSRC